MDNSSAITMQALAACAQARVPAMVVGPPGVGKTAKIRGLAKSMDYDLITLLGSQMDPTDITGLPKGEVITKDDEGNDVWGTVYLSPWWQVQIMRKKRVILFLDEFSNTSSSVRASMLTLLQNREFPNGQAMPDETIVIGAMNPTEEAADGWELDRPTTNRIVFLVWKSPVSEWYEGMLNAWGQEVPETEMYWRRRIVSFLNDSPSYLQKMNTDDQGSPEALGTNVNDASELEVLRYAWASRRSWDNLSRILSFVDQKDVMLQDELASGTVGKSSTIAFRSWILENDVVDPKAVLRNPKSVDWQNIEVSEANILFRALVEMVDAKNWRKVLAVLEAVAEAERQALVGAYITDFLRRIVMAAKSVGTEELNEARSLTKTVLLKYRNATPAVAAE
jgi:MoxR-like ATPase